jgi:hypothetical protein
LALSQSASACSVCFTNQGNAREAFIWTTALMTFVPLFLIGGGILVIRKLLKDDPDQHQLQTLPEPEQDEVVEPSKEKAEIS